MFQPFYRSLGTEVDGSGLGLAIVREIAVQHGAEITVADASARSPAPGTLFTVRLPAQRRTRARPGAAAQLCISRRLFEIDIRMPSPRPSVTIAVPP